MPSSLAARDVGRLVDKPGDKVAGRGGGLDLLEPDGAGVDEIEPIEVMRRVLAVLHEAQRRAARDDDVFACLRGKRQRADQEDRQEKGEQTHAGELNCQSSRGRKSKLWLSQAYK